MGRPAGLFLPHRSTELRYVFLHLVISVNTLFHYVTWEFYNNWHFLGDLTKEWMVLIAGESDNRTVDSIVRKSVSPWLSAPLESNVNVTKIDNQFDFSDHALKDIVLMSLMEVPVGFCSSASKLFFKLQYIDNENWLLCILRLFGHDHSSVKFDKHLFSSLSQFCG